MIELTDDGTLDTVIRCSDCGQEYRFTHDATDSSDVHPQVAYMSFVSDCIAEIVEEHECEQEERCDECGEIICACYNDDEQ